MDLVAEGTDIKDIAAYDALFSEGDRGEVRIYLNTEMSEPAIRQLTKELMEKGALLTGPITCESRILSIRFEKRVAPLLIIAGIASVLGIGFAGWQVFKPKWGAPLGVPMVVWVAGAALIGVLLYMGVKE